MYQRLSSYTVANGCSALQVLGATVERVGVRSCMPLAGFLGALAAEDVDGCSAGIGERGSEPSPERGAACGDRKPTSESVSS